MVIFLKRLVPFLLLGITVLQFIAIEKFSEPFPAILLPPFPANSPIDSIEVSKYEFHQATQDSTIKEITLQEMFPMAPEMTAFYMGLALGKGVGDDQLENRKEQFSQKAEWKQIILRPRERILVNAWQNYPSAIMNMKRRMPGLADKTAEYLIVERRTFVVDWESMVVDTFKKEHARIPLSRMKYGKE